MKRIPSFLALAAGLVLAGQALAGGDPVAPERPAPQLAVYYYGDDVALRDQLIAKGRMYDDIGEYIVGDADSKFGLEYQSLPALLEGEELVIVVNHEHEFEANALERAGRAIWQTSNHRVTFRAYSAEALASESLRGFSCHGSFRKVDADQPIIPSYFPYRTGEDDDDSIYAMITPKPAIQTMVANVNEANILSGINSLVAFGTRRHFQPGEVDAQNWIESQFQSFGLQTSLFDYDSGADVVIGQKLGVTDPTKVVVIGGHYDSINYDGDLEPAPGADDDASGTSAVIEIARILSQSSFDYTIRFCAWSGEEFGLLGSDAYAQDLAANGVDVIGMVQLDMIAYRAGGDSLSVDFVLNDTTPSLNQFAMDAYAAYVPSLTVNSMSLAGGTSDHRSFFQAGFPATFPFEDATYSPYIHGPNDTVGTSANDSNLGKLITQGALATVAELARPATMQITHAPLGDTADEVGPYPVVVTAVPQNGETVTGGTVFYRKNFGAWQSVVMAATVNPDEFSADIPGQTAPAFMDYYTVMDDSGSNSNWDPPALNAGDAFHSFVVGTLNVIYFTDFEEVDDNGWTHGQLATQDDWMRGTPNGSAGDAPSAYSGSNVWGNDLAPGGWNGSYANNVSNWLQSPNIDLSGESGMVLRFQRWLGVEEEQYDQAIIKVNGNEVWRNPAENLVDTAWTEMFIDISQFADNNGATNVRFELITDGGLTFGGWNIDDFELIAVGGGGGGPSVNSISLTGPATAPAGTTAQYDFTNAPVNAPYWFYYSKREDGTAINGQPFDIGPNIKLITTGTTSGTGTGTMFTPNIPNRFSGRTAYVELRVDDGGQTYDSNHLQLDVL